MLWILNNKTKFAGFKTVKTKYITKKTIIYDSSVIVQRVCVCAGTRAHRYKHYLIIICIYI